MKIPAIFIIVILLTIFLSSALFPRDLKISDKSVQDTTIIHKDGTYEGTSQAKYKFEPYWGSVHFTIRNGIYTDINFIIRDSNLHETFNAEYEKHFEGNADYIQQSRNDWKGVQIYPRKLSGKQDIDKIDAISGATWSYNIFRASVMDALKDTK
jgi:major membrane immunogen (membrane-anchored lipoprotein)